MKKIIYLILALFFSCNHTKKETIQPKQKKVPEYLKSVYYTNDEVLSLKYYAVNQGEEEAFKRLIFYYGYNLNKEYELLPIAIIMVEKYNSNSACWYVYDSTIKLYNNGNYSIYFFGKLKKPQRDFVFYYLEKGAQNNDLGCVQQIGRLYRYGIGMKKDLVKAKFYESILLKKDPRYDVLRADEFSMKNGI